VGGGGGGVGRGIVRSYKRQGLGCAGSRERAGEGAKGYQFSVAVKTPEGEAG